MEKKYLLDNNIAIKVLEKIKEIISFEKIGDAKLLIDIDDKLLYDIILKNDVIITTCIIKDDGKFYPKYF